MAKTEKYSAKRKPFNGLFKVEKPNKYVTLISRIPKYSYGYNEYSIEVNENKVKKIVNISTNGRIPLSSFSLSDLGEFGEYVEYFYVIADYKVSEYSKVYIRQNFTVAEFKKFITSSTMKKNLIDPAKTYISFNISKDVFLEMSKKEVEAINKVRKIDNDAKERAIAAEKKRAAEREKNRLEREKANKAAELERKKREEMVNLLSETQDVAMALKILKDKGLNVVVVKDASAGV